MIKRALTPASFAALLTGMALGQTTPNTFDLADVHVSPRATWVKTTPNALQGGFLNAGRYELHRATMVDLIKTAYAVDPDKIYGGPTWLDYDKFEIAAKTTPGTRPEALRQMLQSLLAERFKLAVKPDTKPLPAYVLSVAKDETKLKPADGAVSGGCQSVPTAREAVPMSAIRCRGVTMDEFASGLRRLAAPFFGNLPLVNATALDGAWDIDLKYPERVTRISATGTTSVESGGIFDPIEKQLGLKLEQGTAPQEVLSVESVNEQPSLNLPGAEAALPPLPPPQFEVASIRPCDTTERMSALRIEPGGRVTATCWPLLQLLRQAFDVSGPEQPPGMPKWLETDTPSTRISIVAKAPEGALPNPADSALAQDSLNSMVRALLADRYKLATHYEDRPMDALTLVAAKPKLTKADPSGRTGCTRQRIGGPTRMTCRNITMAQFAEQILGFYAAARYPVLDGTRIEGAWDFTLEYNTLLILLDAQARSNAPVPGAEAAEPTGPATVADAMEKQIGLKLETHKRPEPVLVIDHMEEHPTDN